LNVSGITLPTKRFASTTRYRSRCDEITDLVTKAFHKRSYTLSADGFEYHLANVGRDIKALPVGHLARGDSLLLLWACGCMIPEALEAMGAWGFTFKSEIDAGDPAVPAPHLELQEAPMDTS
jgi:hypothetical protein